MEQVITQPEMVAARRVAPALTVGRVMCVRLGALGDIVFALHALRLLRQERPDLWISWLVEARFSALLKGHPDLDEVFVMPRRRWREFLSPSYNWKSLGHEVRGFVRDLRDMHIDATIDFHGNLRSGVLVRAVSAPIRIGHDPTGGKEFNYVFQNVRVPSPRQQEHRIRKDLRLLGALGVEARYVRPRLPVAEADRESIVERLGPLRQPGRRLVVIHAGVSAFGSIKQWDTSRFAAVADRLVEEEACDVMFSWGPGERDTAGQAVGLMTRAGGNAAPETESVGQLIALLHAADLVIACDTGPLHLAAALGRPVVGLYGPKDPAIYGPIGTTGRIVRGSADCMPCRRRQCGHLSCMKSIGVAEVAAAARQVLQGDGERLLL